MKRTLRARMPAVAGSGTLTPRAGPAANSPGRPRSARAGTTRRRSQRRPLTIVNTGIANTPSVSGTAAGFAGAGTQVFRVGADAAYRESIRFRKLALLACLASTPLAMACTAVDIQATDGTVIVGRTMEWAFDMQWQLRSVPKGTAYNLSAPASLKLPTVAARTRYAFVGIGPGVVPGAGILEGQNSAGLAMSGNFLPGFTQYQTVTPQDTNYVAINDFGTWSLGSFATIAELKAALPAIKVWDDAGASSGPAPPTLHFTFTDRTGAGVVVEYVEGRLRLHDNLAHVLTNAPTYDWHLTNLRNYLNLSASSDSTLRLGTVNVTELGQGGGMLGMPGDYTPPARFVRAAFLRHYATRAATAADGVQLMGHILNNVDIPIGVSVTKDGGQEVSDFTQFVVIKDLMHDRMYVSDYAHRLNYVVLDLGRLFAQDQPTSVLVSTLPYPAASDATASLVR
jgi:penicillin V acylase-like amidase (Ntn superfamily)